MRAWQIPMDWLGLVAGVFWATSGALGAEIALDGIPAAYREEVRRVVDKPTLCVQGPPEVFRGQPTLYEWLLDHPEKAVQLWRGLGARCTEVTDLGGNRHGWTDGQGTMLRWETIVRDSGCRVWYAEGASRPTFLLPTIRARAVVILHYGALANRSGRPLIQHQADLFLQIDSRTAAIITRLLGVSGPRLAEQGLGQMQMFFSALVWYLDRHPEKAEGLLERLAPPEVWKSQISGGR